MSRKPGSRVRAIETVSKPASEYVVGYAKPPTDTRFQPGQSGNTKGRPKGAKTFNMAIEAELDIRVPVKENGKKRTATKRAIIAKQLVNKSAQGDAKGISMLLQNERIAEQAARSGFGPNAPNFAPEDEKVIAGILRRIRTADILEMPASRSGAGGEPETERAGGQS